MVMFSPKEFEGCPLEKVVFKYFNLFISVSVHESKMFLVPTLTAHNVPLIKCCRHKNFKDLMYGCPNMRNIKFENAHFCKGGYLFPSENNVTDTIFFQKNI